MSRLDNRGLHEFRHNRSQRLSPFEQLQQIDSRDAYFFNR